jgi:hypothetical protein
MENSRLTQAKLVRPNLKDKIQNKRPGLWLKSYSACLETLGSTPVPQRFSSTCSLLYKFYRMSSGLRDGHSTQHVPGAVPGFPPFSHLILRTAQDTLHSFM